MRRVFVTGLGVVSALGVEQGDFWRGLTEGRTGIRSDCLKACDQPAHVTVSARVPEFDIRQYINDERVLRVCHRSIALLLIAASAAKADAGFENTVPRARVGVAIGMGTIEQRTEDLLALAAHVSSPDDVASHIVRSYHQLHPLRRLRHLPNIGASLASMTLGAAGPTLTLTSGITAGIQAVLEGFDTVASGRADVMLCGATDSRFSPSLLSMVAAQHQLSRVSDPNAACRPFDRSHSGIVAGEGAAILVLEAEEGVKRRGTAYAELLGGACQTSTVSGLPGALRAVLDRMVARYPQPDTVIAHGDGSVCGDGVEASALSGAPYLKYVEAISSIQTGVGHTFYASGALAAATACLSASEGSVPPIRHLVEPISDLPFVTKAGQAKPPNYVLANVLDPRGSAGALLIGPSRW